MSTKRLIIDVIEHKPTSRIPMMYREELPVNDKLIEYFNLGNLKNDWGKLTELLGADNFSDGETLGVFTIYFPKYIGPDFGTIFEINRFNIWDIKPVEIYIGGNRHIVFSKDPPLYNLDSLADIKNYNYPKLEWFDFSVYKNNSEAIAYETSKAGVTLVKDEDNLIPINKSIYKKILVVSFPIKKISMAEDNIEDNDLLVSFLRKEGIKVEHRTLSGSNNEISFPERIDLVIVCTFGAIFNTGQVKIIEKLQASGIPFIVLSNNPYDLQVFPEVPTFLTIYDYSPFNLKVASEIIAGRYKAQRVLPVTLKI